MISLILHINGFVEPFSTGLNNLKVLTLTDVRFDEYFGVTDAEVRDMHA